MGTDWSPVGQIYFFTMKSSNPQYDVMDLKAIEDWTVEKNFKSVADVVDVSSFGGPTREYQVRLDPTKLISYGLSIAQVEQQLSSNNINAGGSFIEAGQQQINIREVGLVRNIRDIENTVLTAKKGTRLRVTDIAVEAQGTRRSGLANSRARSIATTEESLTTMMSFQGSCSCAKARMRTTRSRESMPR
jgi:cobalt-zinc-cadmium resistance protein CzcA